MAQRLARQKLPADGTDLAFLRGLKGRFQQPEGLVGSTWVGRPKSARGPGTVVRADRSIFGCVYT
jgi:hypothetical protein